MRIAIMGSGGVGGYFGARLAKGGSDVTFLARGAHLAALRERGLIVESADGEVRLPHVKATDDAKTVSDIYFPPSPTHHRAPLVVIRNRMDLTIWTTIRLTVNQKSSAGSR